MKVEVNGDALQFPDGITLAGLLAEVGASRQGVAVAVDGEVVSRGRWGDVVVADGAKVEILTAVQGG
jgi:sulfur carrier protein